MTTKMKAPASSNDNRPTVVWKSFTFYKPTFAAWVSTIVLVSLCLALGAWQVQRLSWKKELITQLEVKNKELPMVKGRLPENIDDLEKEQFRSITLPGEFLHDHEFPIMGRYHNGEVGYDIVTPFKIADDGRLVLVNRGWVPLAKKDPKNRPEDQRFGGLSFASGMIMLPQKANMFMPAHDLKDNIWFWYDIAKMEEVSGLKFAPIIIESINSSPIKDTLPIPKETGQISLRNDHLSYAFIWFSLALSGLTIFFIYHLKEMKGDHPSA